MNLHTIEPSLSVIEDQRSQSRNAGTSDATALDLTNYRGQLHVLISVGSVGAAGTLDAKWQESDDNSTFTDCTGGSPAITQITAAGSAELKRRVRQFTKRYARVRYTVGVNAVVYGATMVALPNKGE